MMSSEIEAIELAKALKGRARLEMQLQERNLLMPDTRYENDSEAFLTWRQDGRCVVSICFECDGRYGIALWREDKYRACEEDGDLTKPIPKELEDYLRWLALERLAAINQELGIE